MADNSNTGLMIIAIVIGAIVLFRMITIFSGGITFSKFLPLAGIVVLFYFIFSMLGGKK